LPRERAGALVVSLIFATGRSFAAGTVGGSFWIESIDSKGALLKVMFKQSQIAHDTNISLRVKNKRAESMGEDARDREHQHERKLRGMHDHRGRGVAYGG